MCHAKRILKEVRICQVQVVAPAVEVSEAAAEEVPAVFGAAAPVVWAEEASVLADSIPVLSTIDPIALTGASVFIAPWAAALCCLYPSF